MASGLKLVAMKMMMPSEELVEKHYTIDPEWMRLAGEVNHNAKRMAYGDD